jgi:hypothetical protein
MGKTRCQLRKLFKFFMLYQQFAFHAYCGAAGPISEMALQQEKAFYVLRFEVSRSVITVLREFHARFKNHAPHKNNVCFKLFTKFTHTAICVPTV